MIHFLNLIKYLLQPCEPGVGPVQLLIKRPHNTKRNICDGWSNNNNGD